MTFPVQIVFKNLRKSISLERLILSKAKKLSTFCDEIINCRVVVEIPHRHHQHGNCYLFCIDINVPGKKIIVNQEPDDETSYKDPKVALRDAFVSAERKLEDYTRKRRSAVKTHTNAYEKAVISELFPEVGYGFLKSADGSLIYFHQHSIVNKNFSQLRIGMPVTFVEEKGDEGLQASAVKIIANSHS